MCCRYNWIAILLLGVALQQTANGQPLLVRDICRVKGQEANTLHGLGLVVGLSGTGDTDPLTVRALAKFVELMGNPLRTDANGQWNLDDLKNSKNVALVTVTATVPAEGARQGDQLSCEVNAFSAKSLAGGYLMLTPLVGPRPDQPKVYALCEGSIALDQNGPPTAGKVRGGCRMEQDVVNEFVRDGKFTLVLDAAHSSFQNAVDVAAAINSMDSTGDTSRPNDAVAAKARDAVNVEVVIPKTYSEAMVEFVSEVLGTRIIPPEQEAVVVIDKRNGVIIVSESVTIGNVAVSHKNIAVQTGGAPLDGNFVIVPQEEDTTTPSLDSLVNSLNALKVSTEDIIAIIESLKSSGALYGRLVYQ